MSLIYLCPSLTWKLILCHVSFVLFLMYLCLLFYFVLYYVGLDRILNSSYLKPIVFLIDIYIPWSKFYR